MDSFGFVVGGSVVDISELLFFGVGCVWFTDTCLVWLYFDCLFVEVVKFVEGVEFVCNTGWYWLFVLFR